MKLRKIIFWLHLTAGVFAGIVVLIMSITGVALTYQKQMTEWADKAYWPPASSTNSGRLPIESLVSTIVAARPDANPSAITFYSDRAAPAAVTIAQGRNLYINPYTGEVGGEGSASIRSFFRFMTDWHRYVGAGAEDRAIGKAVTGACNLAFLFIVVSGFYLWWPRTWNLQAIRSVTWFKRGLTGKARDFNWHNTFGFWTALPLFFVVLSATVISYPFASNLVYRIAGVEPPRPAARATPPGSQNQTAAPSAGLGSSLDLAQLDDILVRVEEQVSEWRTINLRLPGSDDSDVIFTVDRGWGGQPQLRSTIVFDKRTGALLRSQSFADQNRGQQARTWLRFVHTGEFYGLPGQTIAGIASLAGMFLVWTGLALVVRRFVAWLGRQRRRGGLIPAGARLMTERTGTEK
jgi:uncharacterized iron-regulated membrane protein